MIFKVKFFADNAAFDEGGGSAGEVNRILDKVKEGVSAGKAGAFIADANGNIVGSWFFGNEEDEI